MISRTLTFLAVAALVAGLAGCKPNAASVRKEAQANADKYFEFLKAGDLEGAYNNTFSENYKGQLPIGSYVKFQKALNDAGGEVVDYAANDNPKIDLDRHTVSFVYTVKVARAQQPLDYTVRMVQQGSEWRVDSIEPKFSNVAAPPQPNMKLPQKPPEQPAAPPAKKP